MASSQASHAAAMHVLLTGPPGIGKTTLVHRVCDQLKSKGHVSHMHGFYTEEVRQGGRRIGFDVVSLDGQRGQLARIREFIGRPAQKMPQMGQYLVDIPSFESIALSSMKSSTGKSRILALDEIGKMELFSNPFQKAVSDCFQSPNTVILATVPISKGRPIPFVEAIKNRKDAILIMVERENRDKLVEEVTGILMKSLSLVSK